MKATLRLLQAKLERNDCRFSCGYCARLLLLLIGQLGASFRLLPRMPPRTDSTRVSRLPRVTVRVLTCTVRSCVFDRSNRSNGSRKGFLLERQCVRTHSAISCCDVRLNHFHGIDYAVKLLCRRKTQLQSGFFELQVVVQQASVAPPLGAWGVLWLSARSCKPSCFFPHVGSRYSSWRIALAFMPDAKQESGSEGRGRALDRYWRRVTYRRTGNRPPTGTE
jgi:hypothetical protein